jgi:hypothetical protein
MGRRMTKHEKELWDFVWGGYGSVDSVMGAALELSESLSRRKPKRRPHKKRSKRPKEQS